MLAAPPPMMNQQQQQTAEASSSFATGPPPSQQQQQQQTTSLSSSSFAVETQHDDVIHDIQMDFYGSKLATCSSDRTIKIFNVSSSSTNDNSGGAYQLVATLQGHEGPVWQISWAHPQFGVVLASCSFDGSVWIHRESRPNEWSVIHAARPLHESSVNSVAFGPPEYGSNMILAAASSDGRVSVLEHSPTTQVWTVDYLTDCPMGVNAVSWAPPNAFDGIATTKQSTTSTTTTEDNDEAATQSTTTTPKCALALVTAGCDNRIRFWQRTDTMSPPSASGEWTQEGVPQCAAGTLSHQDWVRDVAWAPSPLIPNHNRVASCGEDGQVLMWTLVEEQPGEGEKAEKCWKATLVHQFEEPVWRVSWSTTGLILAVSSGDDTVTLWKEALSTSSSSSSKSKWIRMDQQQQQQQATQQASGTATIQHEI